LKPNVDRAKALLEEFAIEDLQMVGSITLGGTTWALIKDTNGAVHRVSMGDHMGLDYGEIVGLSSHGIEVEEIISDGRGGWIKRPRYVELQQAALNGEQK
ncbi:MAG: pilus assembly protein PilP, partial [Pontibacterium sp.]